MKRIIFFILFAFPIFAMAQRVEVVAVNKASGEVRRSTSYDEYMEDLYIAIFAYGLPRDIVRTNSEMRSSIYSGDGAFYSEVASTYSTATGGYIGAYGVTQRHHTTKGLDEPITPAGGEPNGAGYDVNHKISFAYLIAPYNVASDGSADETSSVTLDWSTASGWNTDLNSEAAAMVANADNSDRIGVGIGASTLNAAATGCAAYKGIGENDPEGTWRLPTQRESQVMFTIMDQAMEFVNTYGVENAIASGNYWTFTEFAEVGANVAWKAFVNNSITGNMFHGIKTTGYYARCIRDIYYDVNDK